MNDRLPILYCDDQYVAIAKPAGMFVHRTNMDRRVRDVVVQTVRDQLHRPVFPVHRVDRPASGIVLMGLSSQAASAASELFRDRKVDKAYLALVRGYPPYDGHIDRPLTKPEAACGEPLEAITEFTTERRFEVPLRSDRFPTTRCSLVRVLPRTGRFHQIRRHLNGINHPVIGDTSHGDSRQNRFFRRYANAVRLMLHAAELRFHHPVTKECVEIRCPMPDDMLGPLTRLTDHSLPETVQHCEPPGHLKPQAGIQFSVRPDGL